MLLCFLNLYSDPIKHQGPALGAASGTHKHEEAVFQTSRGVKDIISPLTWIALRSLQTALLPVACSFFMTVRDTGVCISCQMDEETKAHKEMGPA